MNNKQTHNYTNIKMNKWIDKQESIKHVKPCLTDCFVFMLRNKQREGIVEIEPENKIDK